MLMADVLSISLSVLGFFLSLQGLWLGVRALAPATFDAAQADLRLRRLPSFLFGALFTALTVLVAVIASTAGGPGQALALLLIGAWLVLSSFGVSALATLIGEQLPSPVDTRRPWRRTVRGGVVLELAFLFPLLGWFVLLPAALITGTGAALRTLRRSPISEPEAAP